MLEDSKAYIYSKYKIDPADERAFVAFDNNENYKQIMDLLVLKGNYSGLFV
jgi:hypothetical protein